MDTTHRPFDDSTLFISARSPFARRVRLALHEHGVRYEERVVDLFGPVERLQELYALNPVGRVPALRLKTGEEVVDSSQILELFYLTTPSPLVPVGLQDRARMHLFSGLATGLCDKVVEWFLDSLRPTPDPEVKKELVEILERSLSRLERELADQDWVAGQLTQADLDLGCALDYLNLRFSREWQQVYPRCADYLKRLSARPAFQATQPPPPA